MTVTLRWAANTEEDLGGYKVYYGNSPGVYTGSINTSVPSIEITGLNNGRLYYFAVTALDNSLNESTFSSEVSKINRVVRIRV